MRKEVSKKCVERDRFKVAHALEGGIVSHQRRGFRVQRRCRLQRVRSPEPCCGPDHRSGVRHLQRGCDPLQVWVHRQEAVDLRDLSAVAHPIRQNQQFGQRDGGCDG